MPTPIHSEANPEYNVFSCFASVLPSILLGFPTNCCYWQASPYWFWVLPNICNHWLNGHEFEQTPGGSEGQGSPHTAVYGATKSWRWLSNWTIVTICSFTQLLFKILSKRVGLWKRRLYYIGIFQCFDLDCTEHISSGNVCLLISCKI